MCTNGLYILNHVFTHLLMGKGIVLQRFTRSLGLLAQCVIL